MNLSALGDDQELAVKMEIPLQNPGHAKNIKARFSRIGREQVARQARVFYQELQ